MDAPELLLEKYLDWQRDTGKRGSLKKFAEYIGVGDKYLNHIINRRRPLSESMAIKLADFFRDLRFYDAAGLPRPDPRLQYVNQHWGDAPEEVHRKVAEEIARYTTEKAPNNE